MQKTLQAFIASALAMTSMPVQAQSAGAVMRGMGQPSEQQQRYQQQQRQNNRSGWYTTDGNSRSGQQFDNSAQQNTRNWSQPRQNQNGYDQYQNFDPNEVYLPTSVPQYPVQCQTNTFGVRNPGFMAAVTVADANSCRPIVSATGSRDFITVYDYGYEGRGVREIRIGLRNYQVASVTVGGAQLPPQYGAALLARPLAGIEMSRTGMTGAQRPEIKSVGAWVGLPGYDR